MNNDSAFTLLNYKIQLAQGQHLNGVARLHRRYISGSSVANWEETSVLEAYYREIMNGQKGLLYVALMDERVIGYVSLVRQRKGVWFKAVLQVSVLRKVLSLRPGQWLQLWSTVRQKVFHELLGGKWHGIDQSILRNAYELRSIAVEKDLAKQKVGTELLHAILEHAERDNLLPVIAWVMEGNVASQNLFERMGFKRKVMRLDNPENAVLYMYKS